MTLGSIRGRRTVTYNSGKRSGLFLVVRDSKVLQIRRRMTCFKGLWESSRTDSISYSMDREYRNDSEGGKYLSTQEGKKDDDNSDLDNDLDEAVTFEQHHSIGTIFTAQC
jgi:hypothetical protein